MNGRLPGALVLLAWASAAAAAPGLPESLDDAAFRDLVVSLSEPSGEFADENYVSNELGLERVLPELQARFAPGGVFIGVGPEQNFSYVAALEPGIAFVLDIRRQNMLEHLMYKALFELADDHIDFLSRLFSRPRPAGPGRDTSARELLRAYRVQPQDRSLFEVTLASMLDVLTNQHGFELRAADETAIAKVLAAFYVSGPEIAYVYHDSDEWHPNYAQLVDMTDASGRNWSYLGSEASFERVKVLERRNLIVPVVGDFAGPKALRAIGRFVREHDATVDVFYVSNVEHYLFEDGSLGPFYENVATLPLGDDSVFVRTFFGSMVRACPDRRVIMRTPLTGSIEALLSSYRRSAFGSECELVDRSR